MTDEYDKITELLPDFDEIGRGYIHTYCVFHDDNKKSLMIYPDARGYTPGFYCLSGECGRKGSLQELLRVLEGAPPRPRGDSEKEKPPYLPTDLSDLSTLVNDAHLALLDEAGNVLYQGPSSWDIIFVDGEAVDVVFRGLVPPCVPQLDGF